MRRLALALAAATVLAGAVPASAQTVQAEFGFGPGWGGWGYHWGHHWGHPGHQWGGPYAHGYGPSIGFYAGAPAADPYVYEDRPRRARRVARTRAVTSYDPGFGAYAYAPSYPYGGPYVSAGPQVSVGFGFGPRHPHHPWW